jgi:hypothetical protein
MGEKGTDCMARAQTIRNLHRMVWHDLEGVNALEKTKTGTAK